MSDKVRALSPSDLAVRDVEDELPPVQMRGLRYHTIDGVAHVEGEEYTIQTNVGIASTLVACQFADFVGAPPPPVATGAIAGMPGTWTPSGASAPATLAAMTGITASPTTAWMTGQHMVLGDASHCSWNATAWVTGDAASVIRRR
jgi:hypothetical protein